MCRMADITGEMRAGLHGIECRLVSGKYSNDGIAAAVAVRGGGEKMYVSHLNLIFITVNIDFASVLV